MKYRNSLSIHFKPGKTRVAIPLLKELWNGEGTIMRRIGKETALTGKYRELALLCPSVPAVSHRFLWRLGQLKASKYLGYRAFVPLVLFFLL